MPQESFLKQIARHYTSDAERQHLGRYCFVFPNRRSSVFFKHFLLSELDRNETPAFVPRFTNISDLMSQFAGSVQASSPELLFALYRSYLLVCRKKEIDNVKDFDTFRFWGDLILNDFNDVDKYMANAGKLFANLKDLREIQTDYLTDEQREVIRRFWGDEYDEMRASGSDTGAFWKKFGDADGQMRRHFLYLWEMLYDIYEEFRKTLRYRKLAYPGMAYRDAVEKIREREAGDFPYARYIFVGFNVLSTSEMLLFSKMQKLGIADFYWDFASPSFFKSGHGHIQSSADIRRQDINFNNSATFFTGRNLLEFKSLYPLDIDLDTAAETEINIIAVPGNTAQAKEANGLLEDITKNHGKPALDTCLIVNDESLFVPLLHSIPTCVDNINITLGLPKRHTETATLMSDIFAIHHRARMSGGEMQYFSEDILSVLNHPVILAIAAPEAVKIRTAILTGHRFLVSEKWLTDEFPGLRYIFRHVNAQNSADVSEYVAEIIARISAALEQLRIEGHPFEGHKRQIDTLADYGSAVTEILNLCDRYSVQITDNTYFRLVEGMINSQTVNFAGEPLFGMQIMNMLETRALDFRTLIMTSMNERIFPRKHFAGTFIPDVLRRGYGLATAEHQESMFAYYFYRLISRAEHVYLLYDSRTTGISSGEMSRYLYQLKYLQCYKKLNQITVDCRPVSMQPEPLSVSKKAEDMNQFLEGGGSNLSASALKDYAACPLRFYFKYVRGWRADDDDEGVKEFISPITYGNVVHHVAQKLYEEERERRGDPVMGVLMTRENLETLKKRPSENRRYHSRLEELICREVNAEYFNIRDPKSADRPLKGQARLTADIILESLESMIDKEKKFAPFYFRHAEFQPGNGPFVWPVGGKRLNFKMIIDRVDECAGILRFIDYKTGTDGEVTGDLATLADSRAGDHAFSAVFQLMTYAMAYRDVFGSGEDIQPYIYKLGTVKSQGLRPVRRSEKGATVIADADSIAQFRQGFENLINNLFDCNIPFTQCSNRRNCSFCGFAKVCNRENC